MALSEQRRSGFFDEKAETMSAASRRALQEGLLQRLVPYCYENSSTYRAKLHDAGVRPDDIRTLDDLPTVPITRKSETADLRFEGIQAIPYNQARRVFVSPGPQFYAYGPIPQKMNPMLKVFHAVGFRRGDVILNTFSYHMTPAGISFDEALGEFGCCVVPAGPGQSDLQAEVLAKLPVAGYVGTPSFLTILADKAEELGYDPRGDFSLEAALCTAERLPEPLRVRLEDRYGCIVRQMYGSADGLLPSFECWAAAGMHVPEMMILELTDPATGDPVAPGEPGEVTASVYNPFRPLLRFANGDLARLTDEPCECGRTSVRLTFLGRVDEATKVRGMFVYPEEVELALARFGEIRGWQVVVGSDERGLDTLELLLVAPQEVAEPAAEAFRGRVRLRPDVRIVDAIDDGKRVDDRRTWD